MGNEVCCNNNPEQSEVKFIKPERNLLIEKKNSKNSLIITPQINFETERQYENKEENKEESEDLNDNSNIITNDEFVYGRIDSLKLKKQENLIFKNSFKKKNLNNQNEKSMEGNKQENKISVKNNDSQINNNINDIANMSSNKEIIHSLYLQNKNYLSDENKNIDNMNIKNENLNPPKKTYTPIVIKENNYQLKENEKPNDNSLNNNDLVQSPKQEILIDKLLKEEEAQINENKKTYYEYNDDNLKNIDELYKPNYTNNNINKKVFIKPIIQPISNNIYLDKYNNEQQIHQYNINEKENKNLINNSTMAQNNIIINNSINKSKENKFNNNKNNIPKLNFANVTKIRQEENKNIQNINKYFINNNNSNENDLFRNQNIDENVKINKENTEIKNKKVISEFKPSYSMTEKEIEEILKLSDKNDQLNNNIEQTLKKERDKDIIQNNIPSLSQNTNDYQDILELQYPNNKEISSPFIHTNIINENKMPQSLIENSKNEIIFNQNTNSEKVINNNKIIDYNVINKPEDDKELFPQNLNELLYVGKNEIVQQIHDNFYCNDKNNYTNNINKKEKNNFNYKVNDEEIYINGKINDKSYLNSYIFENEINDKNIIDNKNNENKKINNFTYSKPLSNKNNKIFKEIKSSNNNIPSLETQYQLSLNKIEPKNNIRHNEYEYNNPTKINDQNNYYNSRLSKNNEENNVITYINDKNLDYNNLSKETKHYAELSPTKINKTIIQNKKVEKVAPITYSPTKILPDIIIYENGSSFNQVLPNKNGQIQKGLKINNNNKNNNNEYNLDFISKAKSYDFKNIPKFYTQDSNIYNLYSNKNHDLINNNPYNYKYNNKYSQINTTDSNSSIIDKDYFNKIKYLNMGSIPNYQISFLNNSGMKNSNLSYSNIQKQKFDKLGNPIYNVSLNDSLKNRRIYQNKRILPENTNFKNKKNNANYSPIYYPRSLSHEEFKVSNLRLSKNNDWNSRSSSPNESPLSTPRSNMKIEYLPYQITNLSKVNPQDIEIDIESKKIINYYLNLDLKKFSTFSHDAFNLFYPKHEKYFKIPRNEIYTKIETTNFINNNPSLKELYIGNVNRFYFRHGPGKVIGPSSKKIGTWRNGKFTGWGREIRNNGEVFEGKFNDGKIDGKGIYKYKDILYIGDFENHLRQGKGEKITKNYYYKGDFNNDQIDGYGRIQFINSKDGESEYEGFFKKNNIEGKGIMKWKNGNIYEGEVKNGKMNGEGIFKIQNGPIIKGFFKDGVKVNAY